LTVGFGATFGLNGFVTVTADDLLNNAGTITLSDDSLLTIDNYAIRNGGSRETSINSGKIIINDPIGLSEFTFAENLRNSGQIILGLNNKLQFVAYSYDEAELTGAGQLALSGGVVSQFPHFDSDDYLDNVDDTIVGYGTLSTGNYANEASAVIFADSGAGSLILAANASLTNHGLMEAAEESDNGDSGSLVIDGAVINTGTIETVENGDLTIAGSVTGGNIKSTNAGSTFISGHVSGAALDLSSDDASLVVSGVVAGGSLQTEDGASIAIEGGTLDGTVAQVLTSAALLVAADAGLLSSQLIPTNSRAKSRSRAAR
jgi:hypothetical protein